MRQDMIKAVRGDSDIKNLKFMIILAIKETHTALSASADNYRRNNGNKDVIRESVFRRREAVIRQYSLLLCKGIIFT